MEKMFKAVLKIRWLIIILVLAITVFLAWQIPNIRINSDVISSLPDTDPDAVLLKKIGAQFGGNKMGMIILESDNIFTPGVIKDVRQITDTLRANRRNFFCDKPYKYHGYKRRRKWDGYWEADR